MTNDMLADVISAIMEAADEVKKKADQDDQDYPFNHPRCMYRR